MGSVVGVGLWSRRVGGCVPGGDEQGAAVSSADGAAGPAGHGVGEAGDVLDHVGAGEGEEGRELGGRAAAEEVGVEAGEVGELRGRGLWCGDKWWERREWGWGGGLVAGTFRGAGARVVVVGGSVAAGPLVGWATPRGLAAGGGGRGSRR